MRSLRLASLALAATLGAAEAQSARTLSSPTEFPEPFSNIAGIRERSDGSLLVSDRAEKALYRVDLAKAVYRKVGGNGAGPAEYETPGALLSLPADSTLLVDFGNFRLAVLDPTDRIVTTTPLMVDNSLRMPSASDANGNFYRGQARAVRFGDGASEPESDRAPILRWRRGSDRVDTVATMAKPSTAGMTTAFRVSGGVASSVSPTTPPAYPARDAWAVAPDGRVAVVVADDYHVEWTGDHGATIKGKPVPYQPIEVGQAEREAWIEAQGNHTMVMNIAGQGSRTFTAPKPEMDQVEWPKVLPPFNPQGVFTTPEGDLWVRRYQAAGQHAELYDVFDGQGNLREQVRLPTGRRLLGLGRGVAYVYHADEDDLQWLERYPR